MVVVDSSAEVTCFPNVLLRANLATDEIDTIVCATRHVVQYFVGTTQLPANKLFVLVMCLHKRHLVFKQVFKPPLGNVLSYLAHIHVPCPLNSLGVKLQPLMDPEKSQPFFC